jgi:uncharacterized protein (DUF1499 family)
MRMNRTRIPSIWKALLTIVLAIAVNGCAGFQVENDMNLHDQLFECPDRPNCVSSDAQDSRHAVAPMVLIGDTATGWVAIQTLVSRLSRSTVVKATNRYLHVTFKSRLFRFIDDLELKLDPQSDVIAIRSASRTGHFDRGVNRRRVESLREQLTADGLIR